MVIGITQISIFVFLIFGLIFTYLRKKDGIVKDWLPFLFLWLIYDEMSSIAENQDHINVVPIYRIEKKMFGWMFGGKIPNEWAQNETIQNKPTTLILSFIYVFHLIAIVILALLIYYKSKDYDTFREFSQAVLLTSYLGFVTFASYPVAPPWYIAEYGFIQPETLTNEWKSAAGLLDADNYLGITAFADYYRRFNSHPYAAFPSLHAAFSYFVAYYTIHKYKYKGHKFYFILIYFLVILIASVYLNHHYIVDLIAGIAYSYLSIRIIRYIHQRRRNPDYVNETQEN